MMLAARRLGRLLAPNKSENCSQASLPGEIHCSEGHCQSKFVYFAKTSEPDFAAIDFPAFFRVDLSGLMAAPSIYNFALTTPDETLWPARFDRD